MDDILINKMATIKRCLRRIDEEYRSADNFKADYTKQDSVVLNLQRACEASIDMANHIIKSRDLGVPQSARDSFQLLAQSHIIPADIGDALKKMVGLRNIAVHDYQALNLDILIAVVEGHLADFEHYCHEIKGVMK